MKKVMIFFTFLGANLLLLISCKPSYEVIDYGIVLKDHIPAFDSPSTKGAKPVENFSYGTIVEIVMERGKEIPPHLYMVAKDGKVYYVKQEDILRGVKIVEGGTPKDPGARKRYYAINEGMVFWKDGAVIFSELDAEVKTNISKTTSLTNIVTNLIPKGHNSVNWGTVMYILFTPSVEVTPPSFYTNSVSERVQYSKAQNKQFYFLVMDISNQTFVGYVRSDAVEFGVVPAIAVKEIVKVYSAATSGAKETGFLDLFTLMSVEKSPYGNYCKIRSVPFTSGARTGFVLAEDISTAFPDVFFGLNLMKYTNDFANLSSIDEKKRAEIISLLEDFVNNNPNSKLYIYTLNLLKNISPHEEHDFEKEESDSES
ncbi:MAG: hypothetical protein ABDH28_01410 [Brevinematia bacterium]